jgi:hypothetical protein
MSKEWLPGCVSVIPADATRPRRSMPEPPEPSRRPDTELNLPPPGTPTWVTPALIQRTIAVWQPHYKAQLTTEDAVAMIVGASRLLEQI